MAARKKKPAQKGPKRWSKADQRKATLAALVARARTDGYMPLSRKLRVTNTTLLAVLVGGLARKSSEERVLERFAKLIKRRAA